LLGSTPLALADGAQRDYVKYVIKLDTIVEGTIVDSENEDILVGGASITGVVYSENFSVNENADANGHFMIVLPSGEDHSYILNISALGYDPKTLPESTIKSGEHVNLGKIRINYHPFDLELGENSGSLTRGRSPYDQEVDSHTGEVATTWLFYESLGTTAADNDEAARYNNVEGWRVEERTEQYISGYEQVWVEEGHWETRDRWVDTSHWSDWQYAGSSSRQVSKSEYNSWPTGTRYYSYDYAHGGYTVKRAYWKSSSPIYSYKYVYRYYEYHRNRKWWGGWGDWYYYTSGYKTFDSYKGSSFTTGGSWYQSWKRYYYYRYSYRYVSGYNYYVGYREYHRDWISEGHYEPYQVWVDTSHWEDDPTRPIYEDRMVGYDVYREHREWPVYRDYRRDYSLANWDSLQTTVTAAPRNGYTGSVYLQTTCDGVSPIFGEPFLTLSSPASTGLTLTPYSSANGPTCPVVINGYDRNGRSASSALYELSLSTDPKPSPYTWSQYWYTASWDAPEPGLAVLTVETVPVSGGVYVNGAYWGKAPVTRTLSPGTYGVGFCYVSGYITPSSQIVTLSAGQHKKVTGVYEQPPDFTILVSWSGDLNTTRKISVNGTNGFDESVSLSWTARRYTNGSWVEDDVCHRELDVSFDPISIYPPTSSDSSSYSVMTINHNWRTIRNQDYEITVYGTATNARTRNNVFTVHSGSYP
jgi:hypothetical protein